MITRTDDSDSFGQEGIFKLNVKIPEGQTVKKAILIINDGDIILEYITPIFPIDVHLDSNQSKKLQDDNHCDLILFDGYNKQYTIHCVAHFSSREEAKR
jgi:hypothetical protein